MIISEKIFAIKEEIITISSFLIKGDKYELEIRLDIQLRNLAFLTMIAPGEYQEEIDLIKDHVWALIEKLNRRII